MIVFLNSGYETDCNILHSLEKMFRIPVEQTISTFKARYHVGMHNNLSGFPIQKMSSLRLLRYCLYITIQFYRVQ